MTAEVLDQEWQRLLALLPSDLEQSARQSGALVRRRGVSSAQDLLRLAFAYALCGLSLRSTALWAQEKELAHLSDVALLKRLRRLSPWLTQLLTAKLAERLPRRAGPLPGTQPPAASAPRRRPRVRLLDATYVCRRGSSGTDWRIHLGLDLEALSIDHIEVTDVSGGESLARLPVEAGDLVVADRGYSHRGGITAIVAAGADLIVCLNWHNLPLQDPKGNPFDLLAALRTLAPGEVGEFAVQTAPHPKEGLPAVAGRLIAIAKSEQAAEASRRQVRKEARKKGKTSSASTLEAAGSVFVFTTLPSERLEALAVLELDRFRWQIELAFKRLKGLLALDELAAKDAQLCRSTLLTKLLGALLVEELTGPALQAVALSPWEPLEPDRSAGEPVADAASGRGHAAPGGGGGLDPGPLALPCLPTRRRASGAAAPASPPSPTLLPAP